MSDSEVDALISENEDDGIVEPQVKKPKSTLPRAGTAEDIVYQYMLQQNRPYAPLQISENLHDAVKKVVVSRILDTLCDDGHMISKTYNKVKIYHINQDVFPEADPDTIRGLDEKLERLGRRINELKQETSSTNSEIVQLESQPGTEDAKTRIASLKETNSAKNEKLTAMKSAQGSNAASASIDTIKEKYGMYVREWKKRKRACNEMMDMYLEHVTKTKKAYMREQGLETDEEHKVDLKEHLTLAEQLDVLRPPKPVKQFARK